MDIKDFERLWETEYIKARVDRVVEAVKLGKYDSALDYLSMIQDKAKAAEKILKADCSNK